MKQFLHVKAITRERVLFDGVALSITSVNEVGEFDILPGHSSFISLIKDKLIIRPEESPEISLIIKTAAIRVFKDEVKILIGFNNS